MAGLFLALDGVDGAGKSSQGRLLAEWLRQQGQEVVTCADPGGTAAGAVIRELLLGHRHALDLRCEALLFMASRAQLVAEVIAPALAAGRTVLADRFTLANVVYQGHAGGLDAAQLWEAGRLATGGIEPELTVVLDVPLTVAQGRRKAAADRLESRAADYHERVRAGFLAEARRRPDRVRVVDATAGIAAVQQLIRQEVQGVLAARART